MLPSFWPSGTVLKFDFCGWFGPQGGRSTLEVVGGVRRPHPHTLCDLVPVIIYVKTTNMTICLYRQRISYSQKNPLKTFYVQSITNHLDFGRIGHAEKALFRSTFLTYSMVKMCFNTDTQNIHPWGARHSHRALQKCKMMFLY